MAHEQSGREGDADAATANLLMDSQKWFWPLIREMASDPGRWA